MANPHPDALHARRAKKRRRKPGDMQAVKAKVWNALCEAEAVLLAAEDAELTLKAVHAVSQCAGQYAKLLEIGELEARVQALEAQAGRRTA